MSSGFENSTRDRAPHGDRARRRDREEATRLHASFGRRLRDQSVAEQTLRVLREMMLSAPDAAIYAQRRAAFLRILSQERPPSGFTARIVRYFAADAPDLEFDDRDTLVHAILLHANDDEALVLFLLAMTDQADSVRPIIDRIADDERAFEVLSKLLTAPWLESFRHILAAKLLATARNRQGAFRVWVHKDPETFFLPAIFELFLRRGTNAFSGICKEILVDGPDKQRARLVSQLESEGTESALRLLIAGLPFGGRPCEPSILAAIASFDHQLAVSALREVVHCGNVRAGRTADALRAMRALHSMDNEESREFLDEVATGRCALLPTYRRELRCGATRLLHETDGS